MIYIVVFLSSIFFAALAERSKSKTIIMLCSVISILIPCILGGLRAEEVGIDVRVYALPHFNRALNSPSLYNFLSEFSSLEIGYLTFAYISTKMFRNANFVLFCYQLLTITCMYIGAYKHRKQASITFIMLMFYFALYNYSLNAMRQFMAASIIFMGIDNLENSNYIKFLLYVVIATTFHLSAILLSPFLIIAHMVITSKTYMNKKYFRITFFYGVIILLILLRPLTLFLLNSLPYVAKFNSYASIVTSGRFGNSPAGSKSIMLLGVFMMFVLFPIGAAKVFMHVNNISTVNLDEFYKFNALFCLIYHSVIHFYPRMMLYYEFANIIALSSLPCFIRERNLKLAVYWGTILVMIIYWWHLYIKGNYGGTWPYRSIL